MANGTAAKTKKPYFWQRKYFIDKRFQSKFILRYSIVVAISAVSAFAHSHSIVWR